MEKGNNKKEETEIALRSIKSLFETGDIKRMYDLVKLYPTKIKQGLQLNYGRYIEKLSKPEKFSVSEVIRFALLVGVDHNKVWDLITKEAVTNVKAGLENKKSNPPKKSAAPKKKSLKKRKPK